MALNDFDLLRKPTNKLLIIATTRLRISTLLKDELTMVPAWHPAVCTLDLSASEFTNSFHRAWSWFCDNPLLG